MNALANSSVENLENFGAKVVPAASDAEMDEEITELMMVDGEEIEILQIVPPRQDQKRLQRRAGNMEEKELFNLFK